MYKHQVIGIRQEESWHSRQSEHIVGICTLEALDQDGRFINFDPAADWIAEDGEVQVSGTYQSKDSDLKLRCRHWTREDVIRAMREFTPRHEFYTRDEHDDKIPVYSYLGTTDLLTLAPDVREIKVYRGGKHTLYTLGPKSEEVRFRPGKKGPLYIRGANDLFTVTPDRRKNHEIKVYTGGKRFALYTRDPRSREETDFRPTQETPLYVRDSKPWTRRYVVPKGGFLLCLDDQGNLHEVECRGGDIHWIKTSGDRKHPGNLHWLSPTPIPCPRANCAIIPDDAGAVFRADGPDC